VKDAQEGQSALGKRSRYDYSLERANCSSWGEILIFTTHYYEYQLQNYKKYKTASQ
jgi:hypothetical protein